jgi:hypothetical protein
MVFPYGMNGQMRMVILGLYTVLSGEAGEDDNKVVDQISK